MIRQRAGRDIVTRPDQQVSMLEDGNMPISTSPNSVTAITALLNQGAGLHHESSPAFLATPPTSPPRRSSAYMKKIHPHSAMHTFKDKPVSYAVGGGARGQAGVKTVEDGESGWLKLIIEAFPSVLLSMGGLMLTGALLDSLQSWLVFQNISELFILVPTLLGLKGNLEMNLASRLSTAANLGHLDHPSTRWKLVFGNIALLQIQSACVSGLAAVWSLTLGGLFHGKWNTAAETALICSAAIITATAASLALGTMMCGTVIICRLVNVDPDNIATPVAASMGDLITLIMLAGVSTGLFSIMDTPGPVISVVFILSCLPLWVWIVLRNEYVRDVLNSGWSPLLAAMSISSFGGLVLEKFIEKFIGLAVLIPVMNGICGNLACIYASRISTKLHQYPTGVVGNAEAWDPAPFALFAISVPSQMLFLAVVAILKLGGTVVTFQFIGAYMMACLGLVSFLLFMTFRLCLFLWSRKLDPDNYIFSLITSSGDVAGTALIVAGFHILVWLGETSRLVSREGAK
ncbi:hypothetical protein BC829DRAFT_164744 [Chytridium lagenaria]|nr:hypothetical protein BC829DRAFT_164744 [Chytridium lagenaria]